MKNNKKIFNFQSHKISLKTLFLSYTIFATLLLVLMLIFFGLNIKQYQRVTRFLGQTSVINQQINDLEKEQIKLFSRPYDYLKDEQFLPLKRQLSAIYIKVNELKDDPVLKDKSQVNKVIAHLNNYETTLQKIADLNRKIFSPAEGRKSIIESILNQLKFSSIYNEPPFDRFSEKLFTYYNQLSTKKITIDIFQRRLNELEKEVLDIEANSYAIKIAKQKFIILLKNFNYALSEYYLDLDQYGEPYSTGLFKDLNHELNATRVALNNLAEDVQKLIARHQRNIIIHLGIIIVLIFLILFFFVRYFNRNLNPDLQKILDNANQIYYGKITPFELAYSSLELFNLSTTLNRHLSNLRQRKEIIDRLAQGDYDVEIKILSTVDLLGQSLENLRNELKKHKIEAQKSKEAEDKQRWITEGLAYLAEQMREGSQSLEKLFEISLKGLLDFLKAPMGAFYYLEEENGEKFYKLQVAFAYNKKRIPKLKYRLTEGFIGTVAAEKRTLIIDEVPENYLFYETAFGYGRPDSLMFVPIITDSEVIGVLEIAFLKKIEQHHIQLVEKFASDFATTINFVKINEHTRNLVGELQRQTQQFKQTEQNYLKQINQLEEETKKLKQQIKEYKLLCRTKEDIIAEKVETIFKLEEKLKQKDLELEKTLKRFEEVEQHYQDRIKLLETQIDGLIEELEKLRKQHNNEQ